MPKVIEIDRALLKKYSAELKKRYGLSEYMANVVAKAIILNAIISGRDPEQIDLDEFTKDWVDLGPAVDIMGGGIAFLKKEIKYNGPFTRGILYIEVDLEHGTYRLLEEHEKPRGRKISKKLKERRKEELYKILQEELKKLEEKKRREVM